MVLSACLDILPRGTSARLAFSAHFDPPCRPTLSAFVGFAVGTSISPTTLSACLVSRCLDFLIRFRLVCVPCLLSSSACLLGLPSRLTSSTCLFDSPCRPLSDNRCVAVRENVSPTTLSLLLFFVVAVGENVSPTTLSFLRFFSLGRGRDKCCPYHLVVFSLFLRLVAVGKSVS